MQYQNKPRCLQLYEESIKSQKTLEKYKECLDKFLQWTHKDYESLLLLPSDQLQIILEDYVFYLKKRVGYNTINLYLAAVCKYLTVNDREFRNSKLRMLMPEKQKPAGKLAYTTKQIQRMLEFADTLRNKALINCLAAGGFRAGAFEELKWKHVSEMPDNCYAVIVYPGSNHEYTTFLHHEARKALDDYTTERKQKGELITNESYVMPNYRRSLATKPKPMTPQAVDATILRVVKKAKIQRTREGEGKRFDTAITNGFRKRFNTILKSNANISYAIAERMMDHATYLESIYLDTTDTMKLFGEYKKAIPELIIDESERLELQNKIKDETIKKMESEKDSEIARLKDDMKNVYRLLGQIKKERTENKED